MGASENLAELKSVWKLGFGDDDEWIDGFFKHYHTGGDCYVSRDGQGRIVAQMHALPMSIGGVYIYGVTTHPSWRGRGIARALMAEALRDLAARGVPFAMLIAQEPSLRQWYEGMGFCLGTNVVDVTGYDGECLDNDDLALNLPMIRVVNAQSYVTASIARRQCGLKSPFCLSDGMIPANVGAFAADGGFLPGAELPGAPGLLPADLVRELPVPLPGRIDVIDPRDSR